MFNKLKGLTRGAAQAFSFRSLYGGAPKAAPDESSIKLIDVIQRARRGGFSLQNDYARTNAQVVAMAASCGYITTEHTRGSYGRKWLATRKGLAYLEVQ